MARGSGTPITRGHIIAVEQDALAASEDWAAESGAMPVHAFDQAETILGQGTLGLELEAQAPDLDTIITALAAVLSGRYRPEPGERVGIVAFDR